MNVEQLDAIKEHAASTSFDKAYVKGDPWKGYEVKNEGNGVIIAEVLCETDAEFIATAREYVPMLVAEVERLKSLMAHIYEITHDTFYRKNEDNEYVVKQRYHEDRINIGEIMIVSAENSE